MKWRSLTREERRAAWEAWYKEETNTWRPWFAWYPVQVDGEKVWLQTVERKLWGIGGELGEHFFYNYRLPK